MNGRARQQMAAHKQRKAANRKAHPNLYLLRREAEKKQEALKRLRSDHGFTSGIALAMAATLEAGRTGK